MNKKTTLLKQINETKVRLAQVRESNTPTFKSMGVGILIESELDKASLLLSAEAITDRLTDMAEKVAKIEPDELMKMDAAMKAQVGDEAASRFYSKTVEAVRTLLDQIKVARDSVSNEIKGLKDGQIPNDMTAQEPTALEPDADADAGADTEVGMGDEEGSTDDLAADVSTDDEYSAEPAEPAEPDIEPEPALGRNRKMNESKSKNSDDVILEQFISHMRQSKNANSSAKFVAEKFDIDVFDVKEIVKEAAALTEKKGGFVPFKKKDAEDEDCTDDKDCDDKEKVEEAKKSTAKKGFVPFKKGDGGANGKGKKGGFVPFAKGGKKAVAESADFQPMSIEGWTKAVDKAMKERYAITLTDGAGVDGDDLARMYQGSQESKESISDFVQWFGNRYDLDPVSKY